MDHPDGPVAHMRDIKVQEVPQLETSEPQIAEQLATVDRKDRVDNFSSTTTKFSTMRSALYAASTVKSSYLRGTETCCWLRRRCFSSSYSGSFIGALEQPWTNGRVDLRRLSRYRSRSRPP